MAAIEIKILPAEKNKMIIAISKNSGITASVAKLAKEAGINPNRARFILEDMLTDGSIRREATKNFNKNYIRYKYFITGK